MKISLELIADIKSTEESINERERLDLRMGQKWALEIFASSKIRNRDSLASAADLQAESLKLLSRLRYYHMTIASELSHFYQGNPTLIRNALRDYADHELQKLKTNLAASKDSLNQLRIMKVLPNRLLVT